MTSPLCCRVRVLLRHDQALQQALAELSRLRRFAGAPAEFWPAYMAAAGTLVSASRGLLILRDSAQPDRLKKLSEWSGNGHADRSMLTFNRAMAEIVDSIAVGHDVDGDVEVVLFVVPAEGVDLDDALRERIAQRIRRETTPRHVPRRIVAVAQVPYTISGKKVEKAVRQVVAGEQVTNRDALANPEALDQFTGILE